MSKMTVVAFHPEGDEAAMAAGCEMIVRAIGQFTGVGLVGPASLPVDDAREAALAPPLNPGLRIVVARSAWLDRQGRLSH